MRDKIYFDIENCYFTPEFGIKLQHCASVSQTAMVTGLERNVLNVLYSVLCLNYLLTTKYIFSQTLSVESMHLGVTFYGKQGGSKQLYSGWELS